MKTVNGAIALYIFSLALIFAGVKVASAEESPQIVTDAAELPQEELPSEFYMDYTPDVELILGFDHFDKSDMSLGWMASAHDKSQNRTATGRWYYSPDETVTIHISLGINPETGAEEFLDYRLFKSKFTPRYN